MLFAAGSSGALQYKKDWCVLVLVIHPWLSAASLFLFPLDWGEIVPLSLKHGYPWGELLSHSLPISRKEAAGCFKNCEVGT